jgi:hypothetical protein
MVGDQTWQAVATTNTSAVIVTKVSVVDIVM